MPEQAVAATNPGATNSECKNPNGIGLPTHVTVEHTSSCNLRCFFCEHHRVEVPVKSGFMNGELLGKVEDELLPAASTISCTVSGEPFMDKRLDQIVDMVKKNAGKTLAVVTNGLLMDERRLRVFARLEAPLYVSVSTDTVVPDIYSVMRRGSDYATVMDNIRSFGHRAAALGIKEAHLGISCVLMSHTIAGIPDMVRFAADHGIETIGMAHVVIFEERHIPLSLFNDKARCNAILTEARELAKERNIVVYAPPQFALSENEIETYYRAQPPPCPFLAGRVYINLNGEVEMCCRPGRPKAGNMLTQTFASIWYGDVYREYRDRYTEGDPMPICQSCYIIETYKPYLHERDPFILLQRQLNARNEYRESCSGL